MHGEDPEVKFWAQRDREDQGWCQQQLSFLANFSELASSGMPLFLITVCCSICFSALPFVYSVHGFCAKIGSICSFTDVFTPQCGVIREIPVLFPTKVILIK